MSLRSTLFLAAVYALPFMGNAQKRTPLPEPSLTLKGNFFLPAPIGNPLFKSSTESIGQVDGVLQIPILKGLGVGVGGKMTWYGMNERALAPFVTNGEVRRRTFYGKLQYEQYTGPRAYYELHARLGASTYTFDCPTCTTSNKSNAFHWGLGAAYYIHATDNLSFGLTIGYEVDATRFNAENLGLNNFPGRVQTEEEHNYRNFIIGMGFSTRFRKSEEDTRGW